MATKCFKCGGIIPDVMFCGEDRLDCKNHIKYKFNIDEFIKEQVAIRNED